MQPTRGVTKVYDPADCDFKTHSISNTATEVFPDYASLLVLLYQRPAAVTFWFSGFWGSWERISVSQAISIVWFEPRDNYKSVIRRYPANIKQFILCRVSRFNEKALGSKQYPKSFFLDRSWTLDSGDCWNLPVLQIRSARYFSRCDCGFDQRFVVTVRFIKFTPTQPQSLLGGSPEVLLLAFNDRRNSRAGDLLKVH